jgi:PAP2 superfamily
MLKKLIIILIFISTKLCAQENFITRCNQKVIDVIMEDVFNPPVASRIHAYTNIAAYEVLANSNHQLTSLSNQLNGLQPLPKATQKIDIELAAEIAFLETAKKLVYSEHLITQFINQEIALWQTTHTDTQLLQPSIVYGKTVADSMFSWIKKDNYIYTRTLMRYQLSDSLGAWQPTAPEYANALEPNWHLMRSLVASNSLYVPIAKNISYSDQKKSLFYKNALALNQLYSKLDSSKIKTALYWDDNPKTAVAKGHLTYFVHKATPGAHWLKIAIQACKANHFSNTQTSEVMTMASIAMFEGFLNCWTQKYISNSIRPETYIQRKINQRFKPIIETPPFPEYPSGHSMVSSAIAEMLMHYIPQPYSFTDSSQVYLGIEPRQFLSFTQAAQQASISRFYGGIHFMPALTNGQKAGKQITNYILKHIRTHE